MLAEKYFVIPRNDVYKEVVRKTIHMTVAVVPLLARWNRLAAMVFLAGGLLLYLVSEVARQQGFSQGPVARLTVFVTRKRGGGFVLGPVTLGLGAMASLLLYPHPAATVAIYALAFGDGFASLAGRLYGGIPIPYLRGKTYLGSLVCFLVVYTTSFGVLGNPGKAFSAALAATVTEALPLGDLDNLFVPLAAGLAVLLV